MPHKSFFTLIYSFRIALMFIACLLSASCSRYSIGLEYVSREKSKEGKGKTVFVALFEDDRQERDYIGSLSRGDLGNIRGEIKPAGDVSVWICNALAIALETKGYEVVKTDKPIKQIRLSPDEIFVHGCVKQFFAEPETTRYDPLFLHHYEVIANIKVDVEVVVGSRIYKKPMSSVGTEKEWSTRTLYLGPAPNTYKVALEKALHAIIDDMSGAVMSFSRQIQ